MTFAVLSGVSLIFDWRQEKGMIEPISSSTQTYNLARPVDAECLTQEPIRTRRDQIIQILHSSRRRPDVGVISRLPCRGRRAHNGARGVNCISPAVISAAEDAEILHAA